MACRSPWITWALIVAAASSAAAWGDTVTLKDGRTLEGTITRSGDTMVVRQMDGSDVPINSADIQKVSLNSVQNPADAAAGEWVRIQPQIKRSENLADIISLHQKFLEKYGATPTAEAARTSLASYQAMDGKDFVKFRGQWVSRVKAEVLLREGADKARPALELYKASRLKEAMDQAKEALKVDSENTMALAVGGLAAFRLNDMPSARTYFQELSQVDPSDALAWNNLAVLAFQQKREAEALIHYTRALQAAPENRLILDNVVEALHDFTGGKTVKAYMDLARQAEQIETRVAARMADRGLFRYGNTWVTAEQRDRLNANSASVKAQKNQLEAQYTQVQAALSTIDAQIRQAQDDALAAQNASAIYNTSDPNWILTRNIAATELDRANRRAAALQDQKTQLQSSVIAMKVVAEKLTVALAAADTVRYGGIQRIMELGDVENPPPPAAIDIPPKSAEIVLPQAPVLTDAGASTPSGPTSTQTPVAPIIVNDGTLVPITPAGVITIPGGITGTPWPTTPSPTAPPPITVTPPRNITPPTTPPAPATPPAGPTLHPKPAGS